MVASAIEAAPLEDLGVGSNVPNPSRGAHVPTDPNAAARRARQVYDFGAPREGRALNKVGRLPDKTNRPLWAAIAAAPMADAMAAELFGGQDEIVSASEAEIFQAANDAWIRQEPEEVQRARVGAQALRLLQQELRVSNGAKLTREEWTELKKLRSLKRRGII